MFQRSIASRTALWVLLGSALVLVTSGTILLVHTRDELLQRTHREAAALAGAAASGIQARLDRVEAGTQLLAALIGSRTLDGETLLRDSLHANADLAGLAEAFTPGPGGAPRAAPFVSRKSDGTLMHRNLSHDPTHYWEQPWFLRGLSCADGCWQPPFYSQSRHRWLVNYSAVIRGEGGKVAGLVNADVTLDWLQGILDALKKPDGSHAFVMTSGGRFLANDRTKLIGTSSPLPLADATRSTLSAPTRIDAIPEAGVTSRSWLYRAPIDGTHWTLGLIVPEARIYASTRRLFVVNLTIGILALLAIALTILVVTRRTLAPLGVLADRAERVARGELDFALPSARRPDEIGRLTQAFDAMRHELARHIEELTRTARAQQRLSSELEIAQQIQTSLLPHEHYVQAHCATFELHAALRPARAVGGDLYSYFMLDDRHFCLMVGDVSDKGIPAALFMARTITLAKALSARRLAPQQLLQRLNLELCEGNESCMFVSLLCGVLDIHSGRLLLASAGHDPAILCREDGSHLVEFETGPALGLDEEATYGGYQLQLQPGDTLLLYTDGITEASDCSGKMYGIERALEAVADPPPTDKAREFTRRLLADVEQFVGAADQADDITVLALSWHHPEQEPDTLMLDLTTQPNLQAVFDVLERCSKSLDEAGVAPDLREDVRLVLEELLVNMVEHGQETPHDGEIRLHLRVQDDAIHVDLRDNGRPFNPLQPRQPSAETDHADDEQVGGLGLHLVRALASELDYTHDTDGNHLQLRFINSSSMESQP